LKKNGDKYGERYCPCRVITGNFEEDKVIICPCIYHKQEIKDWGHCLCRLFFDKDYEKKFGKKILQAQKNTAKLKKKSS